MTNILERVTLVYYYPARGAGIIFFQILYQATPAKGMQAFRYSGGIDKITIAKAAGYMGIDVPKFNFSCQHLWCLLKQHFFSESAIQRPSSQHSLVNRWCQRN
uniref:Uncharacterized protein n=1 Tax=Micrurus paraensis TaxID=1970185 RepID=A0A2D4KVA8_9SAUR